MYGAAALLLLLGIHHRRAEYAAKLSAGWIVIAFVTVMGVIAIVVFWIPAG